MGDTTPISLKPLLAWLIPLMSLFSGTYGVLGWWFVDPATLMTAGVVVGVTVVLIVVWWLPVYQVEVLGMTFLAGSAAIAWFQPIMAPNNALVSLVVLMILIQYGQQRYRARYAIGSFVVTVGIATLGEFAPETSRLPLLLREGLYLSAFAATIGSTLFQIWQFSQRLYTAHDTVQRLNDELREQAIHDPLTGLYNRRYVDETLDLEIARAQRSGLPIGVLLIDLDHFKQINDSYGHDAGDAVLQAVAALLQDSVRSGDVVARYGGEEFLMVLPGIPRAPLLARAKAINRGVRSLEIVCPGHVMTQHSCSIGVAVYPDHGLTAAQVIKAADTALYQAKEQGRDRVVVAKELAATGMAEQSPLA